MSVNLPLGGTLRVKGEANPAGPIDSHQHFWRFDPARDTWITDDMAVLRRDYLPGDLRPLLDRHGISGSIAVQADPSVRETRFLLELARENPWILGVVGWADLLAPDLEEQLEAWSGQPRLKGFRHLIQAEKKGFMDRPDFRSGVARLGKAGFTFDLLIYERQLEEAVDFIAALPQQPVVVDHIAKPDISRAPSPAWRRNMKKLAARENVYCKLSGMITETGHMDPEKADFTPYLETVMEAFGPDRLLFGSDWPVCRLKGSYDMVWSLVSDWVAKLSPDKQQAILGGNARKIYNL